MNQTNENHNTNADAKLLLGAVVINAISEVTCYSKDDIKNEEELCEYCIDDFDLLEIVMCVERDTGKIIKDPEINIYNNTVNDMIDWCVNNSA
jgi:acyl carrier protein